VKPEGAFYVYPNISAFLSGGGKSAGNAPMRSAADIAGRLLREAGVVVVPGEAFGTDEHIRVSYPTTLAALDKGLERMRKFFASL
jgi:aspartate aminotransferase